MKLIEKVLNKDDSSLIILQTFNRIRRVFSKVRKRNERYELISICPECGRHPERQIKLAFLFTRLVKRGWKVVILSNSDYISLTLSCLIRIGILKENEVSLYIQKGNTVKKAKVNSEGIMEDSFKEALDKLFNLASFSYKDLLPDKKEYKEVEELLKKYFKEVKK